ncbi:MAG: tetratricopeptide repeat protein [Acidobacteriota bacterium]
MLDLADGFEFLAVATEDVAAEELLGSLLEQFAKENGVNLRGFDLSNPPAGKHLVTAILDEVEQAPRPCWFWFPGGKRTKAEESELGHLFLLLNQKRDVIAKRADAPFLLGLHPFDWKVFRRQAPDFWSIHHAVFRFGPGARPESSRRDIPLDLRLGQDLEKSHRGSIWRMDPGTASESLAGKLVGRTSEIRQLTAVLLERGARLLIRGPGGIGKTSLMRAVLPTVASRYSEGVWWVPFANLPGDPKDRVAAALTGILSDLLPFWAAPPNLEDLAKLFRSATERSPRLFIFDDVEDGESIDWLIPGPSASVVVISRSSRPRRVPIQVLQLGALSEVEAIALLRQIAPMIGDQAAEVARLCGHLPLTLRLAAGALASRPDLTPKELIRGLNEGRKPAPTKYENTLFFVTFSLKALPVELQKRFRQLGVFAGNFDAPAAAAIWGLTHEELEEVGNDLGSLVRSGLLEERKGRFELHPSLCSAVWSPLASEERSLVGLRHAAYFCEVLRQASYLHQKDIKEGLALFDLEAHQIRAGQAWAAANFEVREEASRLASEYPVAGRQLLPLRLLPRELIRWLEQGLAGTRRVHRPGLEGYFLRNLGLALTATGEVQQAIELYEKALRISRETDDRQGEGDAQRNMGRAYEDLGETRRAIEHYEQYLSIAREIGDHRRESDAISHLGMAYSAIGAPEKAIELSEQLLALTRDANDRRGEAVALTHLAKFYHQLGETERSVDLLREALELFREVGDRRGEAGTLNFLGAIYALSGDGKGATETSEHALQYFRAVGDRQGEALALAILGGASYELGENRRAVELLTSQVAISHQLVEPLGEAHSRTTLGNIALDSLDFDAAREHYRTALELFRRVGEQRGEAIVKSRMDQLAEMLEAAGRSEEAADIRARLE